MSELIERLEKATASRVLDCALLMEVEADTDNLRRNTFRPGTPAAYDI